MALFFATAAIMALAGVHGWLFWLGITWQMDPIANVVAIGWGGSVLWGFAKAFVVPTLRQE